MSRILVGVDLLLNLAEESLSIFTHRLFDKIRRWDGELEACVTAESLNAALNNLLELSDRQTAEVTMSRLRQILTFPAEYSKSFHAQESDLTIPDLLAIELYQARQQGISIVCFNEAEYKQICEQDCIDVVIWNVTEFFRRCETNSQLHEVLHSNLQFNEKQFLINLVLKTQQLNDENLIIVDACTLSETDVFQHALVDDAEQSLKEDNQRRNYQTNSKTDNSPDQEPERFIVSELPLHHQRKMQLGKLQSSAGWSNSSVDGLHILLFLFSQYLLMQILQDSLNDRLEANAFSMSPAALGKVLNLVEQSEVSSFLNAATTPEQLAQWFAVLVENALSSDAAQAQDADEITVLSDSTSASDGSLLSSQGSQLQSDVEQTGIENIYWLNHAKQESLLNRGVGREATANLKSSTEIAELNNGSNLPTSEPSLDAPTNNREKNQNDKQPVTEKPIYLDEPFVPVEVVIENGDVPVSEPEESQISEPDLDQLDPVVLIKPIGDIPEGIPLDLIPDPIISPLVNTPEDQVTQTPDADLVSDATSDVEVIPVLDDGSIQSGDAEQSGDTEDLSPEGDFIPEDNSQVDSVEDTPIIPDSTNNTNDPIDNGLEPDLNNDPTDQKPEQKPDWMLLNNPDGSSILEVEPTGKFVIANFGGIGRGITPNAEVIQHVDTLQFTGVEFTAENMLLNQQGDDLVITFENNTELEVVLKNFSLENFDNLSTATGAKLGNISSAGNILFNNQTSIQDGFDVVDPELNLNRVLRANTVTFLNGLDNHTEGWDYSDDVIDGLQGDDRLFGRSGQDKLRGGDGNDRLEGGTNNDYLLGGTGDDILVGGEGSNTLNGGTDRDQFVLSIDGTAIIQDFQPGEDVIGLPEGIAANQILVQVEGANTLLRYNNQTLATLLDIKVDAVFINFINTSGNV